MSVATGRIEGSAIAGSIARRGVRILFRITMVFALPAALFALWWWLSRDSSSVFFPPLSRIIEVFPATWLEGRILSDVVPSILRLLAGYGIALLFGIGLGVVIGLSPTVRKLVEPVLEFFRAVPAPVLVPILMLFLGIFTTMKVAVIAVGCVWPILLNTVEGVRSVDDVLRDTSRTYRLRPLTTLRTLVLRGASPRIFTGARQALSIGLILMVISEMFAANNGLGFSIVQFQRTFALPQMWTGIILLGLVGVGLQLMFRMVERPVLAWYEGFRQAQKGGK